MLPREAVDEFKRIYENRYKVVLTPEEATEMAQRMFDMYLVILRPDKPYEQASSIQRAGECGYDNSSNQVNEHHKRGYGG